MACCYCSISHLNLIHQAIETLVEVPDLLKLVKSEDVSEVVSDALESQNQSKCLVS